MKQIFSLLTILIFSTSCLKTSIDNPESKPPSTVNSTPVKNQTIYKYLKNVKTVDARTVYSISLDELNSNINSIQLTFRGHHKPTMTLYKNEIRNGKKIHLFPPSYKHKTLLINAFDKSNKKMTLIDWIILALL